MAISPAVTDQVHYERMLEKAGARLISITQPTTDDGTGQLLRHLRAARDPKMEGVRYLQLSYVLREQSQAQQS